MPVGRFPGLLCSELPEITGTFYGRVKELQEIRQALDPSRRGRKSVLLRGIGGSGKTQLALRHIQQDLQRYSAVLWVNASTREHAGLSFTEAAGIISSSWPPDLPTVYRRDEADDVLKVTARLRSTRYYNWLLVIDSADELDKDELSRYIPTCEHGSVLVTSTRSRACNGFKPNKPLEVQGLDLQSSSALLLEKAWRASIDDNGKRIEVRTPR